MGDHDDEKQQEPKQTAERNSPAQISTQVTERADDDDHKQIDCPKEETAEAEEATLSEISSLDRKTLLEEKLLVNEITILSQRELQQTEACATQIISLEGTHITSTETENLEGKHVSFESEVKVVKSSSSVDAKETVRGILEEIIFPRTMGCIAPFAEVKMTAKKRQLTEMSNSDCKKAIKRMRSEEPHTTKMCKRDPTQNRSKYLGTKWVKAFSLSAPNSEPPLSLNFKVENALATPNVAAIPNIPKSADKLLIEFPCEKPITTAAEIPSERATITAAVEAISNTKEDPEDHGSTAVTNQPLALSEAEQQKADISNRFKQIMEMFDSFSKNLEKLDVTEVKPQHISETKQPVERKRTFSKDLRTASPRIHRSRYADYVQAKHRADMEKLTSLNMEQMLSLNNVFPQTQTSLQINEVKFEPERKHISTATSFQELHSVQTVTIDCQTSDHQYLGYTSHTTNASVSATRQSTTATTPSVHTEVKLNTQELSGTADVNNPDVPPNKISSDVSDFMLAKVSEPPSGTELAPLITAPCERTFHTIHIESGASPTASSMERPPLCTRLWNVIADFCAAICLCLQVNKDCIFCMGFFVAFVVSASFLTAFFYRTLSVNPQLFRPPSQRFHDHNSVSSSKDTYYI